MVRHIAFTIAFAGCIASPGALHARQRADTLRVSLADARAQAQRANPELAAARLDTAVARGQLRQAGILPFNPSVDVVARPSGDELEAGVTQELEIFGQRGARLRSGRAGMERAGAGVRDVARLVIADVDRTFYRLAAASQRTKLSDEVLGLNARLEDVGRRQLAEGAISRLDYNLAVVELGRARARAAVARREQNQAAIDMARLMGLPSGTPVLAAADTSALGIDVPGVVALADSNIVPDVDRLTAIALQRRPDLQERGAAVRQAEAELSVARREALPNPVLRGVLEQPTVGGSRTFRPGVGFTLPFLNRRQGDRQALRAAARQAEFDRLALAIGVRAEVANAVAAYASASTEVRTLAATVLVPARQNRQLGEIAYREGKIGIPVLLLIQNQALDAELEYWTAWLAAREAVATLASVTGQNIVESSPSESGVRR